MDKHHKSGQAEWVIPVKKQVFIEGVLAFLVVRRRKMGSMAGYLMERRALPGETEVLGVLTFYP